MKLLYNLAILILSGIYHLAGLINNKAKLFNKGRFQILEKIQKSFAGNTKKLVWIHCASLGEFEQGRPIIEIIKRNYDDVKVLLTFFSPSGYEIRKDYSHADHIFYLPWDTNKNANQFVQSVNPVLAIFIKYEFWYNYTSVLKEKNIPIISVSSIFRPGQLFFKWYGGFYKSILFNFDHFFVQTKESETLLKSIGLNNVTLAGDTRFDRVFEITQNAAEIEIAKRFKEDEKVFVLGSIWQEDLEILAPFINEHENSIKFILAPHEISERFISSIEHSLSAKSIRYSKAVENMESYTVLIIDNIGMLSRLYKYGVFAYVGGAFGKGLHNILEAACYGIPIFFGNKNYEKFQEAKDLIMRGGAFALNDYTDLKNTFELMISKPETYLLACEVNRSYVKENLGATNKILSYCSKFLS